MRLKHQLSFVVIFRAAVHAIGFSCTNSREELPRHGRRNRLPVRSRSPIPRLVIDDDNIDIYQHSFK